MRNEQEKILAATRSAVESFVLQALEARLPELVRNAVQGELARLARSSVVGAHDVGPAAVVRSKLKRNGAQVAPVATAKPVERELVIIPTPEKFRKGSLKASIVRTLQRWMTAKDAFDVISEVRPTTPGSFQSTISQLLADGLVSKRRRRENGLTVWLYKAMVKP